MKYYKINYTIYSQACQAWIESKLTLPLARKSFKQAQTAIASALCIEEAMNGQAPSLEIKGIVIQGISRVIYSY